MELRGFPLPDGIPSFPSGEIYYKYLQNYTKHFDLEKHIQVSGTFVTYSYDASKRPLLSFAVS